MLLLFGICVTDPVEVLFGAEAGLQERPLASLIDLCARKQ
jgi:hypothetical protein